MTLRLEDAICSFILLPCSSKKKTSLQKMKHKKKPVETFFSLGQDCFFDFRSVFQFSSYKDPLFYHTRPHLSSFVTPKSQNTSTWSAGFFPRFISGTWQTMQVENLYLKMTLLDQWFLVKQPRKNINFHVRLVKHLSFCLNCHVRLLKFLWRKSGLIFVALISRKMDGCVL